MANKISSKDNEARADSSLVSEMTDQTTGQSVVMTLPEQTAKRDRLFSQNIKAGFFILPKHFAFSSLALMLFLASNMAYANGSCILPYETESTATMGSYSLYCGDFAEATGKNSVALGSYSRAERENEMNIGIWERQDDGTYKPVATRTLSGVSEGINSDEAVNKGQLDRAIAGIAGTGTSGGVSAEEARGYASTAKAEAGVYTDDTARRTLQSANENTERRAVIAENNAVIRSGQYTDESSARTLESAGIYTSHQAAQAENSAVARSGVYTNHRVNALKQQMDRNEKRANGGIAGAMAMSAITGTGSGFGMAISGYRDQGAIAAGIQKSLTPDTSVNLKAAWDSGNGVGVAAGFFTSW